MFNDVYDNRLPEKTEATRDNYRLYIGLMSLPDQLVWDIEDLVMETDNGLLLQWLTNSSGDRYDITVDHLHKIGAVKARDIILSLKDFFPNGLIPLSQEERRAALAMEQMSDGEFDEFDERFEEPSETLLSGCEDLYGCAIEYLQKQGIDFEAFTKAKAGYV